MEECVSFVGDSVYIYSSKLNEVILGVIEGIDEHRRRYRVLQYLSDDSEECIRHIISYIYVFTTEEEAVRCKEEYMKNFSTSIRTGNIVQLLDSLRMPVIDRDGIPLLYQVVAVYNEKQKVSLVTSYGEYIGTYKVSDILYVEEGPLFKKEDYEAGTDVVWIDNEDVYEGTITALYDTSAKIVNIKKLMPVNHSVRIPYWKIPEGRKSTVSTSNVLHTIVGDDLD